MSKNTTNKGKLLAATKVATLALATLLPIFSMMNAKADLGSPLSTIEVPEPDNLGEFVRNKPAAIRLGKALFWDMQVGSDGVQSCASCHFAAGTDNRAKNQLSPGGRDASDGPISPFTDLTFEPTASGAQGGPNYTLRPADYPFHQLNNVNNNRSQVLFDTNDITGSQGIFLRDFVTVEPGNPVDRCDPRNDPIFNVIGINTRRVGPRNAPPVINAVFNFRQFWDGRARNEFNGVNHLGENDPNARIFKLINGRLTPVAVRIRDASLASQATDPIVADIEMSCAGRRAVNIGEKLLSPGITPLAKQRVHLNDSVLGALARSNGRGLRLSYARLIKQAFRPEFYQSQELVTKDGEQVTQMEANFSLFFGLAVQLYQATLVSDQTPLDQFLAGNKSALTPQQKLGLEVFEGQGRCTSCHDGALLASAKNGGARVDRFFNIGVRPISEDVGAIEEQDRGLFKTPILRNIELTGPYFHTGGQATLRQVVDFYNRGGDFPNQFTDSAVRPLELNDRQKDALVAFMLSFTDERVRFQRAPFDHPQLFIPNGHPGDEFIVTNNGEGEASTAFRTLPPVGAQGSATPLRPYLNLNPFQP